MFRSPARQLGILAVLALVGFGAARFPRTSSVAPMEGQAGDPVEVTVREGTSMALALSPDNRTLVIDLQGTLWTLAATGGAATPITDELYDARQPAWSPDGRSIAFQSFRGGDWDIWTISPDGNGAKKLTSGPFDDREPHWSRDGTRVAFSSDRGGSYDIWQVEVKTGEVKQLTTDAGNEFGPVWSHDDREIAFVSTRPDAPGIYAMDTAGSQRLVATGTGQMNAPAWTPNGDIIYNAIADDESRLVYKGRALTTGENVFPFRPQWITEKEFFYVADGRIRKRALDAASSQTVDFTATFSFNRTAYTMKRRDFDARERPALGIVKPVVSRDGRQVAFAALGDIWRLPIGGTPERVTNDHFLDTDPAWSPDGTQLLFSSDRAGSMDIWIRDLASGTDRRLTELPGSEMAGAFSPDGSRVVFVSNVGLFAVDIYLADVKTGALKKVHDTVFGPSDPEWSPDGRLLMFAALKRYSTRFREGLNEFVTFPVDGGEDRSFFPTPHRSSDTRTGAGPVWSPDGRRIAFVMEGTLHVMDVTQGGAPDGAPRRITTEIAHDPSWTGDSRRILYLSSEKLRMVSVDGGTPQDVPLGLTYTHKIPEGRLVIHAGALVDGRRASARTNVDIVIEGHRIAAIESHRDDLHEGTVLDASGLTAMPGLIEMHGHLLKEYGEAMGRAWLAYGVTTVRNPAAMTPYMSIEDREAVEAGVRPGPRIFASGYQMDGSRIYYPLGLSITSAEQLEMELERIRMLDLDLIKTYVRMPDVFQKRVVEFGHAIGVPVTSHEIYPAVAFGAHRTEHTSGTSRRGYSPKMTSLGYTYEDVLSLMAKGGMAYTPTASLGGGYAAITQKEPRLLEDPRFRLLFPPWVTNPSSGGRRFGGESRLKRTGAIVNAAQRAGVAILAGTDSPITPYGLSLQTELQMLVQYGGLTPFEAIQTATVNAAEALGAGADLGSLEPGKLADLVLVDGNPLVDIRNAINVRKVVKNGELFELDDLVTMRSN